MYEQADSLKPVADKLGLTIQTADGLTRTPNPALGNSPVNNAKFLKALFSNDAVRQQAQHRSGRSGAEHPGGRPRGRVQAGQPSVRWPKSRRAIRQRVTQEEALRLARQAGEAKLAAAKASGDATGFGDAKTRVAHREQPPIDTTPPRSPC